MVAQVFGPFRVGFRDRDLSIQSVLLCSRLYRHSFDLPVCSWYVRSSGLVRSIFHKDFFWSRNMGSLILRSFRFGSEDLRKLDALVDAENAKNVGANWAPKINRSNFLRHLICLRYLQWEKECADIDASIERAKKKGKRVLAKNGKLASA